MTVRLLLVCAVSTPEQAKDDKESMAAQERDLLAIAARENWDVIDIVRIPGFSRRYFTLRELVEAANAGGEPGPAQLEKHLADCDFDVMAVRSTNRFGREQSLNAEIIGRVVRGCGARIYSQTDGMIDAANFRPMAAITGYRDAGQVDELVRGRAMGIVGNAKKGLPPTSRVPLSHRLVRDAQTGKPERLELRDDQLPLLRDLAALVLEGVSYNRLEIELFERFGYGKDGKPYYQNTFVRLLLNPAVWGNTAIRWKRQKQQNFPTGTWALDASEPPPPGVDIFYDTHAPAFAGATAERLKAELRRRHGVYNRFGQRKSNRFTGLVYCDACHWRMTYARHSPNGKAYVYLRCNQSQTTDGYRYTCENKTLVPEGDVQAWFDHFITDCLAKNAVLFNTHAAPDTAEQDAATLRAALGKLERRRDTLIDELGESDDPTRIAMRRRIQAATVEIERAKQQLYELELHVNRTRQQTRSQAQALAELRAISLPAFWQLPPLEVNQWLLRLLGSYRLYASGGAIQGWFSLQDIE